MASTRATSSALYSSSTEPAEECASSSALVTPMMLRTDRGRSLRHRTKPQMGSPDRTLRSSHTSYSSHLMSAVFTVFLMMEGWMCCFSTFTRVAWYFFSLPSTGTSPSPPALRALIVITPAISLSTTVDITVPAMVGMPIVTGKVLTRTSRSMFWLCNSASCSSVRGSNDLVRCSVVYTARTPSFIPVVLRITLPRRHPYELPMSVQVTQRGLTAAPAPNDVMTFILFEWQYFINSTFVLVLSIQSRT
mmetsp:Transcript_13599/g.34706  ORF Transcript_13599/g.34706 Transcript_13599/m.34706 type:complete len:248 (-) Transcript_13599:283-1026(-)